MEGWGRSCGAATIVNAVPTWRGAALGVSLTVKAHVRLSENMRTPLESFTANVCRAALESMGEPPYGVEAEVESEIPQSQGMKSSSAVANALILATADAVGRRLDAFTVLRFNAHICKSLGVSRTGALDDAAACLLGGVQVTDNLSERIVSSYPPKDECAVFLIPAGQVRKPVPRVFHAGVADSLLNAHRLARRGRYHDALNLNGVVYASAVGYDCTPIVSAFRAGASASGVTGNGPAYVALCEGSAVEEIAGAWRYLGEVIVTSVKGLEGAGSR